MKRYILLISAILVSSIAFAQEFQVPENYTFETTEDYKPYEKDIMACVDWLIETPMYQNPSKRKEASAFLLKWLMGSPYVHIEINPEIVNFAGSSSELLLAFMGGWAKYAIETEQFDDKVGGNLAGLESVIKFYETNKGVLPKDKNVERYVKMHKKGSLKQYVEKKI